ncbi:glycosyltransferase family 4 protein [Marinobacter bohaiensis]|uniref:glycosyltransferase family 4 protein n=1 Tax=Marinobacter bohaiensis TaxID=2201898 RepID=UPI000DABC20C|nr:glycosyltransferase family 4 protein [Marinobacter bohaiensis]
MKLCIVMDQYNHPHAGTESQVFKLVEGLSRKGWELRFAVFRGTDYTRSGEFPVPVEELGVGRVADPGSWRRVYRFARTLKAEGFGLVHVFFNDASVICPPMMRLAGLQTIISRRDMGFWYSSLYLRALRLTGLWVSAAVCNSEAVATLTRDAERLPDNKVHVIYNGYPVDAMEPTVLSPHRPPVVIGIVANLRPIKRIDDLIRSVAGLVAEGGDVVLRIVGGGDPAPYQALAGQLGLGDRVQFAGSQPDPERWIEAFDIAVLCSESEGFSNAIIEYMRCGKPVVCTRTGGNPEIVSDGENGFLVEVGDVEGMTRRLQHLIERPELRQAMGREGQLRVMRRYSVQTMLDRHVALYRTLMKEERAA